MKQRKIKSFYLILLVISTLALGCSKVKNILSKKVVSRTTGLKMSANDENFPFATSYTDQADPPGTVFVEGGTFTMGATQDDVMYEWNNQPKQMHVQSFYMDEAEVTNLMYKQYLYWLKKVFPPTESEFKHVYSGALPDTLVWRSSMGNMEGMVTNYLRHPAFSEYPVVGVSWLQAVEFCKWRTDRVNELVLEKNGYLKKNLHKDLKEGIPFDNEGYIVAPEKSFGGRIDSLQGDKKKKKDSISVFAKAEDGVVLPNFRLPTELEWEYAAGNIGIRKYNNTSTRNAFPWNYSYSRNISFRDGGEQLANFKQGKGDYGGIAGWSDDGGDITVKIMSYPPNQFGLYDMAGNVSEWVQDVYRPLIDDSQSDFNYFRGNIFKEPAIDSDGSVVFFEDKEVDYDTLPNGRIIARALPGDVKKVNVKSKNNTALRTNFSRSYNINYDDGDKESRRDYGSTDKEKDQTGNNRMYNSPIPKAQVLEDGTLKLIPDKSDSRTTLISDYTRVYKGGSWKDRAYWLDPSQRRFLAEYQSASDIGFRCAVTRVGDKSLGDRKLRSPKRKKNKRR